MHQEMETQINIRSGSRSGPLKIQMHEIQRKTVQDCHNLPPTISGQTAGPVAAFPLASLFHFGMHFIEFRGDARPQGPRQKSVKAFPPQILLRF